MFFIMAGGFYIASLLIKDGSSDFKRLLDFKRTSAAMFLFQEKNGFMFRDS